MDLNFPFSSFIFRSTSFPKLLKNGVANQQLCLWMLQLQIFAGSLQLIDWMMRQKLASLWKKNKQINLKYMILDLTRQNSDLRLYPYVGSIPNTLSILDISAMQNCFLWTPDSLNTWLTKINLNPKTLFETLRIVVDILKDFFQDFLKNFFFKDKLSCIFSKDQ